MSIRHPGVHLIVPSCAQRRGNRQVFQSPLTITQAVRDDKLCAGRALFRRIVYHYPLHMATCPRCKGHLTDSHRCPRRSYLIVLEMLASAVVGGALGLFLVVVFDPQLQRITDVDSMISVVASPFPACVRASE